MAALLYQLVDLVYYAYFIMIILYIVSSWIPGLREAGFMNIVASLVEPILSPFRKIIPPLGMIDLSPIVTIFALGLARSGAKALINMIFGPGI